MGVEIVKANEQALYRFFADDGALLYVGVSLHPFARMGQHRGDKSWWGEVASTTIERFPDRASVLAAEREAIKRERPRYNVVHAGQPKRSKRPEALFAYTYWEPAVGGVLTVYDVCPMVPAAFLTCCASCEVWYVARDVTDHGGDDFHALGKCTCGTSASFNVPKAHPRGDVNLSEHSPYLMLRRH